MQVCDVAIRIRLFRTFTTTRLHSSRMHTACSLTVYTSMHCAGGCLVPEVVPGLGGVPEPGGAWSRGFWSRGGGVGPRGGV